MGRRCYNRTTRSRVREFLQLEKETVLQINLGPNKTELMWITDPKDKRDKEREKYLPSTAWVFPLILTSLFFNFMIFTKNETNSSKEIRETLQIVEPNVQNLTLILESFFFSQLLILKKKRKSFIKDAKFSILIKTLLQIQC